MSGSKNDRGPIVVGGEPRIDFLPTETKKRKEYRRQRRSLVALIIMVAVACAVAVVFTTTLAATGQLGLTVEQARTQDLVKQQLQYSEAQGAAAELQTAQNAELVASATDVVWADYIDELVKALPPGAATTRPDHRRAVRSRRPRRSQRSPAGTTRSFRVRGDRHTRSRDCRCCAAEIHGHSLLRR